LIDHPHYSIHLDFAINTPRFGKKCLYNLQFGYCDEYDIVKAFFLMAFGTLSLLKARIHANKKSIWDLRILSLRRNTTFIAFFYMSHKKWSRPAIRNDQECNVFGERICEHHQKKLCDAYKLTMFVETKWRIIKHDIWKFIWSFSTVEALQELGSNYENI
jgi:hypothetical protein